jgi:hypothetical protein
MSSPAHAYCHHLARQEQRWRAGRKDMSNKRRKVTYVLTERGSLSLGKMPRCTQESIFCFLFPSDLARCASVSTGVRQATESPWLWGEFLTGPCTSPKVAFFARPASAKPIYLLGDRMAMNLCSMPLRLQYEMANKKALRFLTEGVISLTETIALWDEMPQLFFNLLKNDYATEEWISGQITLAELKTLWVASIPGFYAQFRRP